MYCIVLYCIVLYCSYLVGHSDLVRANYSYQQKRLHGRNPYDWEEKGQEDIPKYLASIINGAQSLASEGGTLRPVAVFAKGRHQVFNLRRFLDPAIPDRSGTSGLPHIPGTVAWGNQKCTRQGRSVCGNGYNGYKAI